MLRKIILILIILFVPNRLGVPNIEDISKPPIKKTITNIDQEKAKKLLSFLFLFHGRYIPEPRVKNGN